MNLDDYSSENTSKYKNMSFTKERNCKTDQNATQTMPMPHNYSFMQISMYVQASFTVSKQLSADNF